MRLVRRRTCSFPVEQTLYLSRAENLKQLRTRLLPLHMSTVVTELLHERYCDRVIRGVPVFLLLIGTFGEPAGAAAGFGVARTPVYTQTDTPRDSGNEEQSYTCLDGGYC